MEFDRIFFGDLSVELALETLLRTTVMYIYTLALVRVLGKRGLGQLSGFDLVIIVALGAAVGDPMFYRDVPLISGMIVISAVVGLERLLVNVTERSKSVERVVERTPVLLVRDGVVLTEALDREDLSQDELYMRLRERGVESLGEVNRAYLETSGNVSVLTESPAPRERQSFHRNSGAPISPVGGKILRGRSRRPPSQLQ